MTMLDKFECPFCAQVVDTFDEAIDDFDTPTAEIVWMHREGMTTWFRCEKVPAHRVDRNEPGANLSPTPPTSSSIKREPLPMSTGPSLTAMPPPGTTVRVRVGPNMKPEYAGRLAVIVHPHPHAPNTARVELDNGVNVWLHITGME